MAAVFEFVFELFGRLIRGRIKVYFIGFQKGELKLLFCEYGETKCKCIPFFAYIFSCLSRQVRSPIGLHSPNLSFSYTLLG